MTILASKILSKNKFPSLSEEKYQQKIEPLQETFLNIQQAIWQKKERVIVVIEGMDASGKGGVLKVATALLDPRGFRVYPISAPTIAELDEHYLERFWRKIPSKGMISFFDRSWYGRILVEKVERLAPEKRIDQAYEEITHFEQTLVDDGVKIFKFLLVVSKDEQLKRFEARLKDPKKNWKINDDDIRNRAKWNEYVKCMDKMIEKTSDAVSWNVIEANDKQFARCEIMEILNQELREFNTVEVKKYSDKKVKELLLKLE